MEQEIKNNHWIQGLLHQILVIFIAVALSVIVVRYFNGEIANTNSKIAVVNFYKVATAFEHDKQKQQQVLDKMTQHLIDLSNQGYLVFNERQYISAPKSIDITNQIINEYKK